MAGDFELRATRDVVDGSLEARILEGRDSPAAFTDQMMVVLTAGIATLETGRLRAEVNALHELQVCELLERPVDARAPDAVEASIDLEGR